jgi:uncharacterized protein (TIGR00295 family)
MIPDHSTALALHKELGSSKEIVEHCDAVARVARTIAQKFIAKGIAVDSESIYAAALLHDIGRTKTHSVAHGYVGAELLKEKKVDEKVTRIVSRHVGAGISNDEAKKFGFPPGDYVPRTLEERIVCFADKVVGAHGKVVPLELEIEKFRKKGLDASRLETLKKSLAIDLGEDPELGLA